MWYRMPCIISYDIRDLVMPHYRLDVAGDIGDISDTHFDTIGTEIKKILSKYLQETVNEKF